MRSASLESICPICDRLRDPNPRYPRLVCPDCAWRAVDANGQALDFFNSSFGGGIAGRYRDTGAPYSSTNCFIDGVPCRAEEARMGGIVIQTSR